MIDREIKRRLGQMMEGVQVVSATDGETARAYCSHWVGQVSFEDPIVMASVSPKHDTHPLMMATGRWTVSILGADQIAEGQYFSYPGRKFDYIAPEYLTDIGGNQVVPNCIAWLVCETIEVKTDVGGIRLDHDLVFGRVVETGDFGRLKEPCLLYSSRLGWRRSGEPAREPGVSIRDQLLERLEESQSE